MSSPPKKLNINYSKCSCMKNIDINKIVRKVSKFMKTYPKSFSKLKIKDIIIKNRIISSPRNINSASLSGEVSSKTIVILKI